MHKLFKSCFIYAFCQLGLIIFICGFVLRPCIETMHVIVRLSKIRFTDVYVNVQIILSFQILQSLMSLISD